MRPVSCEVQLQKRQSRAEGPAAGCLRGVMQTNMVGVDSWRTNPNILHLHSETLERLCGVLSQRGEPVLDPIQACGSTDWDFSKHAEPFAALTALDMSNLPSQSTRSREGVVLHNL